MANHDLFANTMTPNNLLDIIIPKDNKLLRFFNETLMYRYNPDINGYTLIFFVPPPLSGLTTPQDVFNGSEYTKFPSQNPATLQDMFDKVSKRITFGGVDFTTPQETLNTEKISSRSGAIPYATEFITSEQMSVTYIDDSDLTIYNFHQLWMHYIWDIVEGKLKPDPKYLEETIDINPNSSDKGGGAIYQGIDYAGSFYIVKYRPDLKIMSYIGKCIGVFPQALPSKELIGQRTTNELTTLPFNYFCAAYRSEVLTELVSKKSDGSYVQSLDGAHKEKYWIFSEFINNILTKF